MAVEKRTVWRWAGYASAWLLFAVPTAIVIFFNSSTSVVVASHDATVEPSLNRHVTIRTGPFLPDVRQPSESPLGVDIVLGKTQADSTEELVERYAFIASQPQSQVAIIKRALTSLAWDAAARGAVLGVIPLFLWALLGPRRRRELLGVTAQRRLVVFLASGTAIVAAVALVVKPWQSDGGVVVDETKWQSLEEYLPDLKVPPEGRGIEVQGTLASSATKRLLSSAVGTYKGSRDFYDGARDKAAELVLRQPEEGETVALIVSAAMNG